MNFNLKTFFEYAGEKKIFSHLPPESSKKLAQKVFDHWHAFSVVMPDFLIKAASTLKDEKMSSSLIEIAWEEMGEGNEEQRHSKLFQNSGEKIGLSLNCVDKSFLKKLNFFETRCNYWTLGFAFGLEVIANENIAYLFKSLAFNKSARETLKDDLFFKIHFQNEDQHIELNFNNFTKYCHSEEQKKIFINGVDLALDFWKDFWQEATNLNEESMEQQA